MEKKKKEKARSCDPRAFERGVVQPLLYLWHSWHFSRIFVYMLLLL